MPHKNGLSSRLLRDRRPDSPSANENQDNEDEDGAFLTVPAPGTNVHLRSTFHRKHDEPASSGLQQSDDLNNGSNNNNSSNNNNNNNHHSNASGAIHRRGNGETEKNATVLPVLTNGHDSHQNMDDSPLRGLQQQQLQHQRDDKQHHLQAPSLQQNGSFFQNLFYGNPLFQAGEQEGRLGRDSARSSLSVPHSHHSSESGSRRGSSSSLDSVSLTKRRRSHRGGSISRLSDVFDEESGEAATLMTYMRGMGLLYARARRLVWRAIQAVFVKRPQRPKVVCEAEVLEQVGWVCRDYIVARLVSREMMSRKIGVTPSNWLTSRHVIAAGVCLESLYPRIYTGLSRKLSLTMSSVVLVRTTLALLLDVLFEHDITWAKVVSMMAVAGLYAEECVSQGHPDFVPEIVGVVVDFTGSHLLPWMVLQGGWDGFPLPESDERNRVSKFRVTLVASGALTLAVLRYYLYYS